MRTLWLLPLAALCALPLSAQDTAKAAPYEIASAAEPAPIVTDTTHTLASSFEPGASEEYTMDDGDEIHVDVSGRPELTGDYVLGPDGRITIPSVGVVDLAGLTREQAADAVKTAMYPFYKDPYVTVGVVHYLSNHILLLGDVKNPGMQSFDDTPSLLEVLSRAGIGTETGVGNTTTGTVAGMPDRAYIYRGSQEVAVVDVKKLLSGGSMSDLKLRRGDVVMVPVENQLISVLGAVKNPGAIHYSSDSTMQVLLSQAGGLAEQAGSNPLIQVVNVANGTSVEFRFNQLLDPRHGNDISLHPGDVIFVPSSGFAKFAYVVDKLNPITTVISFAALALQ
ncbi:MAG TPA: polysaccharide biosynthesis/export family protein [Acidobacteriaceae bacterium]|jgi:polysaccharide export outer membrane protein|nr:polysaccharide biosynthesis/export family protein [Acidobacteriaceae bacterium]